MDKNLKARKLPICLPLVCIVQIITGNVLYNALLLLGLVITADTVVHWHLLGVFLFTFRIYSDKIKPRGNYKNMHIRRKGFVITWNSVLFFVSLIVKLIKTENQLTRSLPESVMETCSVVLTFESVDEILWCDHSNETSSAVLLHGTISFQYFTKWHLGFYLYHSSSLKG